MDEFEDYIMHYGVPGMKWGVRKERPASERGRVSSSRKAKVKKAIKKGTSNLRSYAKQRRIDNAEAKVAKSLKDTSKKNSLSALSDEELNKRAKRLQAENQYLDALAQNRQKKMTKGDRAKAAIKQSLAKAGKQGLDSVLNYAVNKAVKKITEGKPAPDSKFDLSELSRNPKNLTDKQLEGALKRIKLEEGYQKYANSLRKHSKDSVATSGSQGERSTLRKKETSHPEGKHFA